MTSQNASLRIALVGCGQIADAHLSQIQRIRGVEVVSCCDLNEDLAYQAAARFQVPRYDTNLERMLADCRPDVVHLTTPAQTHGALAIQLLEAGCHVYVEKPFTIDAAEAERVLNVAQRTQRKLCLGHDQLFDPAWLTCRSWIDQGRIGAVRHIESILGYPFDGAFGAAVASNPRHWVRQLPGGLFQNTISHPLYRITDLMGEAQPGIAGGWRTRAGRAFPTELEIFLHSAEQTASLTFSTLLPPQRITRILGERGMIEVDLDAQTVKLLPQTKFPGAFAKIEAPLRQCANSLWNLKHNIGRFLFADLHYFGGMKTMFEQFYRAVSTGSPLPIPCSEMSRVTLLLDRIFEHCREQEEQNRVLNVQGEDASPSRAAFAGTHEETACR